MQEQIKEKDMIIQELNNKLLSSHKNIVLHSDSQVSSSGMPVSSGTTQMIVMEGGGQ